MTAQEIQSIVEQDLGWQPEPYNTNRRGCPVYTKGENTFLKAVNGWKAPQELQTRGLNYPALYKRWSETFCALIAIQAMKKKSYD